MHALIAELAFIELFETTTTAFTTLFTGLHHKVRGYWCLRNGAQFFSKTDVIKEVLIIAVERFSVGSMEAPWETKAKV